MITMKLDLSLNAGPLRIFWIHRSDIANQVRGGDLPVHAEAMRSRVRVRRRVLRLARFVQPMIRYFDFPPILLRRFGKIGTLADQAAHVHHRVAVLRIDLKRFLQVGDSVVNRRAVLPLEILFSWIGQGPGFLGFILRSARLRDQVAMTSTHRSTPANSSLAYSMGRFDQLLVLGDSASFSFRSFCSGSVKLSPAHTTAKRGTTKPTSCADQAEALVEVEFPHWF